MGSKKEQFKKEINQILRQACHKFQKLTRSDRWSKVADYTNTRWNVINPGFEIKLSSIQCKNRFNDYLQNNSTQQQVSIVGWEKKIFEYHCKGFSYKKIVKELQNNIPGVSLGTLRNCVKNIKQKIGRSIAHVYQQELKNQLNDELFEKYQSKDYFRIFLVFLSRGVILKHYISKNISIENLRISATQYKENNQNLKLSKKKLQAKKSQEDVFQLRQQREGYLQKKSELSKQIKGFMNAILQAYNNAPTKMGKDYLKLKSVLASEKWRISKNIIQGQIDLNDEYSVVYDDIEDYSQVQSVVFIKSHHSEKEQIALKEKIQTAKQPSQKILKLGNFQTFMQRT